MRQASQHLKKLAEDSRSSMKQLFKGAETLDYVAKLHASVENIATDPS